MSEIKVGKKEKMKFAKISKISLDDVILIGEELYYRLMVIQIPFIDIETVM